jgi:hypothetical protein
MIYETIGGKQVDTDQDRTILRFLKMGDRFSNRNGDGLWEVIDEKCRFQPGGSPIRRCRNLKSGGTDWKLCRIQVIKR